MIDPGPWILTIADKSRVVTVEEAMDGGMVEFTDAITGLHAGSAGIHWWREESYRVRYEGPLPVRPDPDRWIT